MPGLLLQAVLLISLAGFSQAQDTSSVPIIQNITALQQRLSESTPVGTVLGQLVAYDPDNTPVVYTILGSGGEYFQVDRLTGKVTLKAILDFETLKKIPSILVVEDQDGQKSRRDCELIITDENDEAPVFRKVINEYINEAQQPGLIIDTLEVDDKDTKNDIITVECIPDTANLRDACDTFRLQIVKRSNKDFIAQIILNKKLDYEKRKSYIILYEAFDGVNRERNEVHIVVLDVNDSPPQWEKTGPQTTDEEEPIGTPITTVSATDQDDFEKRDIHYELIELDTDKFNINNLTGVISNAVRLDFDGPNSQKDRPFDITIKAREIIRFNGTEILGDDASTTATINIKITMKDINDNAPEFIENGRNKTSYEVYIDEDIASSANIPGLLMTVTDRDQTERFNTFRLETDSYQDTFRIIPDSDSASTSPTLYVVNSGNIDYESGPREYIIKVTAPESLTNPAFTGSTTVTIRVNDVNDETPSFGSDIIEIEVSETAAGGTPLIRIEATDREEGQFGQSGIRYKLYGNIPEHFTIGELTGQLSVKKCIVAGVPGVPGTDPCIDFEVRKQYILSVSATDNGGVDGLTSSKQVTVNILDENDNSPVVDPVFIRYIYEEQTVTINPLIIEAQDPDTVGGPLSYSITGDQDNIWKITLGTRPGQNGGLYANITARSPVSYSPDQEEYNFNVVASDQKSSVSTRVTIIVLDINNNDPYFESTRYRQSLDETSQGEKFLLQVKARDADSPQTDNGIIDFAIQSGGGGKFQLKNRANTTDDAFTIDVFTTEGAVYDYGKQTQYRLILECRDRGTPNSRTGTTLVLIDIQDENNIVPTIIPTSATINVREDTGFGTSVYKIIADDPDIKKQLRFFMKAEEATQPTGAPSQEPFENLFRVNEISGDVFVNGKLNREDVAFITNELTVEDQGSDPIQTGTGALFIRITEFNDQDPVFTTVPYYNVSLQEEKTRNSVVRALECSDEDDKIADYFIFQVEPRFPQYFTLLPQTGLVIVNNRIDYDGNDPLEIISMTVTCVDTGEPQRTATTSFYVYVENINDNSPIFDEDFYRGSVTEGTTFVETKLQQVLAKDIDKGDYGIVRYRLSNDDPYFRIDAESGEIYVKVNATFDREVNPRYDIQVVAYDSPLDASVRRESSVPVYIAIQDINDNCPVFTLTKYSNAVPESFEMDTTILDIGATDDDIGLNGQMVFDIQPNSGEPPGAELLFYIDSRDGYGRLLTAVPLKNRVGIKKFNVTATDKSTVNPCTVVVPVTVEVKESQNDAPEWIRPPKRDWVIYVLESQYNGMLVYNAKAHDSNEGPNGVVDYFFHVENQFVPNTNEFRINRVTGVIRADVVFDREQVDRYFLTLMARDQGTPSASSETTLTVIILDVDDNDPKFRTKDGVVVPLVLQLEENNKPENDDLYLGNCSYLASDADSDVENNKIFYKLLTTSRNIQDHIRVDKDTCSIYLKKAADYETQSSLEFDILAYNEKNDDSVIRYKREVNPSILPVVVNIQDINDNSPEFSESLYLACASVDSSYRETIVQVEATDPDEGDTQGIRYSLLTERDTFGISSVLGTIYNRISFRYGSQGRREYSTTVQAADPDGRTATAMVRILISDSSNLVKLKVNRPRVDVEPFRQLIISSIKSNSNGKIDFACIDSITNHVDDDGEETTTSSDVYVMAAWVPNPDGAYDIIPARDLAAMISAMMASEDNKLGDIYVTQVEEKKDSDDWDLDEDVVLAIFIICILLIVLAIILLCLACYCIRRSKKKKIRKLKAERHTIVAPQPAAASTNPVYMMGPDNDEYATVQKVRPTAQQAPIAPVVIPAPENLQPLSSEAPQNLEPAEPVVVSPPEEPEPFIETEVLPGPTQTQESRPKVFEHPEYEDTIETTVVEDEPKTPTSEPEPSELPSETVTQPVTSAQEPEPFMPPPPADEGEIDVEIKDTPPASPDSHRKGD